MKRGTKSVLYGAHAFWHHPFFVAWAWWRLFGFPWDWRLWVCFFVHDIGYWGLDQMDDEEGERHVERGARLALKINGGDNDFDRSWYYFCLYHSRFWAGKRGVPVSALCIADKLATTLYPRWFYVFLTRTTGEIYEYMDAAKHRKDLKYAGPAHGSFKTCIEWFTKLQWHLREWCLARLVALDFNGWHTPYEIRCQIAASNEGRYARTRTAT